MLLKNLDGYKLTTTKQAITSFAGLPLLLDMARRSPRTASGTIAIGDPLCSAAGGVPRKWVSGTDPVAAFIATATSAGEAFRKSATASRAARSIASVSALVGYAQCVLAL